MLRSHYQFFELPYEELYCSFLCKECMRIYTYFLICKKNPKTIGYIFFDRYFYMKNYRELLRHHRQIWIELSRNAPYTFLFSSYQKYRTCGFFKGTHPLSRMVFFPKDFFPDNYFSESIFPNYFFPQTTVVTNTYCPNTFAKFLLLL